MLTACGSLRWQLTVYRATLWLYPAEFRRIFGRDMTHAFAEALEQNSMSAVSIGSPRVWLWAATDLVRVALPGQMKNPGLLIPLFSFASAGVILASLDWALLHGPALNRLLAHLLRG